MLDFIKNMADESPVILIILLAIVADMFSVFANMVVNIFKICIGG